MTTFGDAGRYRFRSRVADADGVYAPAVAASGSVLWTAGPRRIDGSRIGGILRRHPLATIDATPQARHLRPARPCSHLRHQGLVHRHRPPAARPRWERRLGYVPVLGHGGVPVDGVRAVVLRVTAVGLPAGQDGGGAFVTAFPFDADMPATSDLNVTAGGISSNLVTVAPGSYGYVNLAAVGAPVHAIVDVAGYYADAPGPVGTSFVPAAPFRVLDSRAGIGTQRAPFSADRSRRVQITGDRVPAGARAVVLNLTAVVPRASAGGRAGFLTASPSGAPRPATSDLNTAPGSITSNLAIVRLGTGGAIDVYSLAGVTDVVADVAGWYVDTAPPPTTAGSRYRPLEPRRIFDTRPSATLRAGETRTLIVPGLPAGTVAVAMNLTAVVPAAPAGGAAGFVTAFPGGSSLPTASNLNTTPGQVVPNLVVVAVGPGGTVSLFNAAGRTDLVADLAGAFVAA